MLTSFVNFYQDMRGFVTSTTSTVTDENGIERVRTETKQFVYKADEEPFYNVFIKYIKWMFDINSIVTLKVLAYLLEIAEFNTGRVSLTAGERLRLMESVKITKSAVTRAVKELVDAGAITSVCRVNKETGEQIIMRGEYMINPQMFWKGELKKRKQLIVEFRAVYDDEQESDDITWENSSFSDVGAGDTSN